MISNLTLQNHFSNDQEGHRVQETNNINNQDDPDDSHYGEDQEGHITFSPHGDNRKSHPDDSI